VKPRWTLAVNTSPGSREVRFAHSSEVRVGLLLPADPDLAREVSRGAALAAALLGTAASPVRVVEGRVEGPWGSEAARVVEMVYAGGAAGVVTPPDRNGSHLAAQIAGKARVPVLVGSAASALTRVPLPWMFRVVPDERDVLDALLAALPAAERALPPLSFGCGGREGDRVAEEVARAVLRAGGSPPRSFPCGPGGAGREPGVAAAAEAPRSPVLLSLPAPAARAVLEDLRAAGWRGTALALPLPGADPAAFAAALGERGEGVLLARTYDPSAGEGRAFRDAWRARYDGEPGEAAAAARDGVALLVRAVRASDGTAEGTRAALLAGDPLPGATGPLSFEADGNRAGAASVAVVRGGALRPLPAPATGSEERP
ncbi:MAG: ABC transporter substrate-binding protein, partial [Planctomycetes bacterium]|nr:ABC transporter substrate-binding protein [Planctomycetota bacterium]